MKKGKAASGKYLKKAAGFAKAKRNGNQNKAPVEEQEGVNADDQT